MSGLVREMTVVRGVADGVVDMFRQRIYEDGAKLGGDFKCEKSSLGWLADQLEAAADERVVEVAHHAPPDHLEVFGRGGDHGEDINVNVLNTRDGERAYSLSALTPDGARKLAAELRAL